MTSMHSFSRPTNRAFLGLASLMCIFTTTAHAMDDAECGAVEEQATVILDSEYGLEVTQSATSISQASERGCVVTNLDIYVEALAVTYRAEQVTFGGTGLMDWVRGDVVLPPDFGVFVEGVALSTRFDIPDDRQWLRDVQANSIFLSVTWSEAARQILVDTLRLDMGDDNAVIFSLEGQAPEWAPYDLPLDALEVQNASLDILFNGLFERAIQPPIEANGNPLTSSSLAFLAAATEGLLSNAPAALISTDARSSVVAFLRSLPTPRGRLTLEVTSVPPFDQDRAVESLRRGGLLDAATLEGLNLDAMWRPAN